MASKPKVKMSNAERAKQFMPFSPLSGLGMAMIKKEKEKIREKRKALADDKEEELNEKLGLLEEGDTAEILFYSRGMYLKLCGDVEELNKTQKFLIIDGTKIRFFDIYEIKIK